MYYVHLSAIDMVECATLRSMHWINYGGCQLWQVYYKDDSKDKKAIIQLTLGQILVHHHLVNLVLCDNRRNLHILQFKVRTDVFVNARFLAAKVRSSFAYSLAHSGNDG